MPPIFPLPFVPDEFVALSNGSDPRGLGWGAPRNPPEKYGLHAAVDLLAPARTPVLAVDWGYIVELYREGYYLNTGVIGIRHPMFVARYGEIQPAKGLGIGTVVQQGQVIGEVVTANNAKRTQMLHFEMFDDLETGSLSDKSNKPYNRRRDVIDPTPFLRSWADQLKADQAEVTELADKAPKTFPWLGALRPLSTTDDVRKALKDAGFRQESVKKEVRLMPVAEFVWHPRFGKFPNPNRERSQLSEFWSKAVDGGQAVVRLSLALGGWTQFKEWVLARHWDAYMKQVADHVPVAVYDDAGKLFTVAAVERI